MSSGAILRVERFGFVPIPVVVLVLLLAIAAEGLVEDGDEAEAWCV